MASFLLAQGTDAVESSEVKATSSNTGTVASPIKVKTNREYEIPSGESVTTTTTSSKGFPDLIPTLIPALQSSSYVLVILAAFLAWSSRKLVTTFLERHLELMAEVKGSLEAERSNNEKQIAVLNQLTQTNATLAVSLDKAISVRQEK